MQPKSFHQGKKFNQRLCAWRLFHDYSQEEAGNLLGVTGKYVGMLERGDKEVEEGSSIARLLSMYEAEDASRKSEGNIVKEQARGYDATRGAHATSTQAHGVTLRPSVAARLKEFSETTRMPQSDIAGAAIENYLDAIEHGADNNNRRP